MEDKKTPKQGESALKQLMRLAATNTSSPRPIKKSDVPGAMLRRSRDTGAQLRAFKDSQGND